MKSTKFKISALALFAALISVTSLSAQQMNGTGPGQGQGQGKGYCQNIPNLTAEQQTKIEKLRTAHLKEMLPLRNQMNEKRARLQTLQTAENADINAINATIDEMGVIRTTMQKKSAAHKQEIRKLLTDEQKIYFDSRPNKGHGNGQCRGNDAGYGKGNGMNCRKM